MFTRKIDQYPYSGPDIIRFQRLAILARIKIYNIELGDGGAFLGRRSRPPVRGEQRRRRRRAWGKYGETCKFRAEQAIFSFTLTVHPAPSSSLNTITSNWWTCSPAPAWTELRHVHLFEHEREIKDVFITTLLQITTRRR